MSAPTDIKCNCVYCKGSLVFEASEFVVSFEGLDGKKIFGQEIECPHCGKQTRIYRMTSEMIQDSVAGKSEYQKKESEKLRARADSFITAAIFFLVFAILALVVTIIVTSSVMSGYSYDINERDQDVIVGSGLTSGLLGLAGWFYLVAQIIHIRANTHKD